MSGHRSSHRAVLHGLVVEGPFPLPGGPATWQRPSDVVYRVRRGRPAVATGRVLAHVDDGARRATLTDEGSGWLLALHGTASVRFDHERPEADVVAAPDVSDALLEVLLAGPATVVVAAARGVVLLHASAVLARAGVVGFVGPAGAGKSTLARALASTATPLFSDDSLRVSGGAAPLAHRGTLMSRLRHPEEGGRTSADGRWLAEAPAAAPEVAPLAALVHPRLSPAYDEVRVRPVTGADAVLLLAGCAALPGLLDRDLRAAHFEACARLAQDVPVLLLELPWTGPGSRPPAGLLDLLVSHAGVRVPVRG